MREPDELLIPHMVIMPVYTNDMYAFVENVTALRRAIKTVCIRIRYQNYGYTYVQKPI